MYSEPEIVETDDLSTRAYVKTYFNGKRYRLYNGRAIGIKCNPNRATTVKERTRYLQELCYQFKKKLEKGWTPEPVTSAKAETVQQKLITIEDSFKGLLRKISTEGISEVYYRDLHQMYLHFTRFLKVEKLWNKPLTVIDAVLVDSFLQQFRSSGTNYMTKRRTLSALLTRVLQKAPNPVQASSKMKQAAHLNLPYRQEQLKTVLGYVEGYHQTLYLCCLMMYGCFLRPHEEIRLLKRSSFNEDLTRISLGGADNKSRRVRTVHVPAYIKTQLLKKDIMSLPENFNIMSRSVQPFNKSYFTTTWNRAKTVLLKKKLIQKDHTLYSFRHSAAVNMYKKTQDPYKIQQAFGHSSLRVTLTYLRNLGMIMDTSIEDLPDLPM